MTQYLEDFSPVETICNSTIATIKRFGPLEPLSSFTSCKLIEAMHFHSNILQTVQCVRGEPDFGIQLRIITELGKLLPRPQVEDTLIVPSFQSIAPNRFSHSRDQFVVYFTIENHKRHWDGPQSKFLSICNLAAHAGLFEYITWVFEPARNLTYEPWEIVGLIEVWLLTGDVSTFAFIESIFKQGLSPNMTTSRSGSTILANIPEEASLSIWELFLNRKLSILLETSNDALLSLSVVEIFLKYGADPRISFSATLPEKTDKDLETDYGDVHVIISFSPSSNSQQITKMFRHGGGPHFFRTYGGKATLQDFFEFVLKDNDGEWPNYFYMEGGLELLKRCLALIDRNLDLIKEPPIALEDEPSVSTDAEKLIPAPENDKSPLDSLVEGGEAEEKKQWLLDQTNTSDTSDDSQVKKSIGVEETLIFLAKVIRSPFAPFVLGILISYLYFCFVAK
ncbi:hypothetical protein B0J14DRAFT_283945 [Halenospora varia]|nr:hypothetical protein B0J14DRAFT_283945 [Halenospora varia]